MHAAINLEGIVVKIRHVVVVEIYRYRPPVPVLFRWIVGAIDGMRAVRVSVSLNVDPIVKVSDIIVSDDVPWSVETDRCVRRKLGREFLTVHSIELGPESPNPSKEVIRIIPSQEIAVGDVEVTRT